MRFCVLCTCVLLGAVGAQGKRNPVPTNGSAPITVPMAVDHNQPLIDVVIPRSDGSTTQVKALIDNASPDLWMSRRVAEALGSKIDCDAQICAGTLTSQGPAVYVGEMKIPLWLTSKIKIPAGDAKIFPGTNIEITLPSTLLQNYDVLIDFPDRRFTLGQPGTIHFAGASSKVQIDRIDGAIQVPSKIENKKYYFILDVAAPISALSATLFEQLSAAHPDWPHMTGAVGPANPGFADAETKLKVIRVNRVQFGSLFLIDLPAKEASDGQSSKFKNISGAEIAGRLGADVLLNYRVGIDYAHSVLYFDIGRMSQFPEFDVIGLTLRPENSGGFTVIGIAEFEGKSSVPDVNIGDRLTAVDEIPVANSTMGQVWSMLGGSPGQERKLTIQRSGKDITVPGTVRHFLAVQPDQDNEKSERPKN
ncbi:MAG: hypothetical protein WB729_07120 [Candidatus Sulfotelmatobacter sp.]